MSISSLPVELLQQIFSYLSYHDLQQTSLVCHHWHEASEKFIVCKVMFNATQTSVQSDESDEQCRIDSANTIRNSIRNYRAIYLNGFTTVENWQQLQPIVAECVRKFPTICELYLKEFRCQDLYCLYTTYRDWMTQCGSIQVSLRSCHRSNTEMESEEQVEWFLTLPNLKRLSWRECEYDPLRTVTIDALNLESIYLKGSKGSFPGEVRLRCRRLKQVNCKPQESEFPKMFVTGLESVETLQLILDNRTDLGFLKELHRLRELQITFLCKMKSLDELVEMCAGLPIRTLDVRSSIEGSSLDLQELFENLADLKSLKLHRIDFFAEHDIVAKELEELNLQSVEYCDDITLNVPKLQHLTLDLDVLDKINFVYTTSLSELCLFWPSEDLGKSLDHTVYSFLDAHGAVTSLILINDYCSRKGNILDKSTNVRVLLNLRKLELRWFTVTVDFFRAIAESELLQNLTLIGCTIDCTGLADEEHVRLASVEQMVTEQQYSLINSKRTDFPLLTGRSIDD